MFSFVTSHLYSYSHEQSIANIAALGRTKIEDGPSSLMQSTVSNTGACSTTSWIAFVKCSMNTLRGLFSLFNKGLCFFHNLRAQVNGWAAPVSISTNTGPRLWLLIFFRYPQFHVSQPCAVSVRMTNFTMILTLPFRAISA
jgi:hypothetical protein